MIKKIMIASSASLAGLFMAGASLAAQPSYGDQPGYSQASECGSGHGSFAYFDGDFNLGTKSLGPGTPNYHEGAVGQDPGATGYNNSHTDCQAS